MHKVAVMGLFSLVLSFQGCNLQQLMQKGDNAVRSSAEQNFKPYFPAAQVYISENPKSLFVLTCAENLGYSALQKIAVVVEQNEGVQRLRGFEGKLLGYRFLALGFREYLLMLDLQTGQEALLPTQRFAEYDSHYENSCGNVHQATRVLGKAVSVYVGLFRLRFVDSSGASSVKTVTDTLGLYTSEDFQMQRDAEVADREAMIISEMKAHGCSDISIELESVKRLPFSYDQLTQ